MKILLLRRLENTEEENGYYIDAIKRFGGEVLIIDEDINEDSLIANLKIVTGILLPGGNDVGKLDFFLIDYAIKYNLRLLGICQGMQSMALCGDRDKLVTIGNNLHKQEEGYVHKVFLKNSKLKDIVKKDMILVNSHHYQTVLKSKCFDVVGKSEDGLIEAVENKNANFQIGVQWHPERMLNYDEVSCQIFRRFLN